MNEDQSPEGHEFLHGQTDDLAVQEYLNVTDDGEIARLAAMMAPKSEAFDPAALVNAAIALQTESKAGLIRRREAMVAAMNYSTLEALQQALGLSVSPYVEDDDIGLRDPIIGPVLRKLHSAVSVHLKRSDDLEESRTAADIDDCLASADARTDLPRPSLPCDLEVALRYAVNAPRVSWAALEKAFKDSLGLTEVGPDKHEEEFQQKCRDDYSKALAELGKNAEDEPRRTELQAAVDLCHSNLADIQNARSFREDFTPGHEIPTRISNAAARIYANYFQNPRCVNRKEILARFSKEFHEFWKTHGEAYQRIESEKEKARKKISKQNAKAQSRAVVIRENRRWLEQTGKFLAFLKARKARPSDPQIREMIENYCVEQSGLRKPTSQKKAKEFLGLLCNSSARSLDEAEINRTLKGCGLRTVSTEGFEACLDLLGALSKRRR